MNGWVDARVLEGEEVMLLFFFLIFIYLPEPGLSCGIWDQVP